MLPLGRKTTSTRFSKPCAMVSTREPSGRQRINAPVRPRGRAFRAAQVVPVRITGREVKPAVRAKREPVETSIVAVAEAGQDDGAFVRAAITVGVFERHQIRRIGGK